MNTSHVVTLNELLTLTARAAVIIIKFLIIPRNNYEKLSGNKYEY